MKDLAMAVFAVFYTYDDRLELRMQSRPDHRDYLQGLLEDGRLLAAGAYSDDAQPGGLLLFRGDSVDEVTDLVHHDPYYGAGVISAVDMRRWSAAFGPWAESAA
jgi:uncharacterized protein YciI